MERKPMYKLPMSPAAVVERIAEQKYAMDRAASNRQGTNKSIAKNAAANKYAVSNKTKAGNSAPNANAGEIYKEDTAVKKRIEMKSDLKNYTQPASTEPEITQQRLQDAIIWSEILGKPVSKRGKRRRSWQ